MLDVVLIKILLSELRLKVGVEAAAELHKGVKFPHPSCNKIKLEIEFHSEMFQGGEKERNETQE